jgi:hypothetical protein
MKKILKKLFQRIGIFPPSLKMGFPPLLRKEWVRKLLSPYSILIRSHGIIDWGNVWYHCAVFTKEIDEII